MDADSKCIILVDLEAPAVVWECPDDQPNLRYFSSRASHMINDKFFVSNSKTKIKS